MDFQVNFRVYKVIKHKKIKRDRKPNQYFKKAGKIVRKRKVLYF